MERMILLMTGWTPTGTSSPIIWGNRAEPATGAIDVVPACGLLGFAVSHLYRG
jgi:hypothetical protein